MESFPDLGTRVKTHLCYAHVFRDALTQSELVARCDPGNPGPVERELTLLEAEGAIERVGEYWFRRGEGVPDWRTTKETRERLTKDILSMNRSLLQLLTRLPIVRMLAVSGSLARGHTVPDPKKPLDLDLFAVTSPGGVHVVRLIVKVRKTITGLLAALRLTSKRPLPCLNFTTESTFLEITNESFFTATDALHVRVLKGEPEYQRFLAANSWMTRYYPVALSAPLPSEDGEDGRHLGHEALNWVCFSILAALSWVRNRPAGLPFPYAIDFRWDKKHCLRRGTGFSGGGYQPQVARQFCEIYRQHFGAEQQLWSFSFRAPRTPAYTSTGCTLPPSTRGCSNTMNEYYERVGAYFDHDAEEFDERYWANPVLQRIRQVFREEVKCLPFRSALEVGCGTGLDLVHFATIFPERILHGIDVSPEMVRWTQARIDHSGGANARVSLASVERAPDLLGAGAFDMCYVFFGALNTVEDLHRAADRLYAATAPGGHLVLTFVNRWYLADIALELVRGRWKSAFRRMGSVWGGYNPNRPLPSRCVTPREVRRAFGRGGHMLKRSGFSITYPAWYRSRWLPKLGRASQWLWALDRWLNRTPAWATGEYTLYVFRRSSGAPA